MAVVKTKIGILDFAGGENAAPPPPNLVNITTSPAPAGALTGAQGAKAAPPPPPLLDHVIYRSIDGSGNNLTHTDMNAVGTDYIRLGPAHYADGISQLRGGPNAREISNIVVAGQGDVADAHGLSAYMYAWGQFIDHDLDLTKSGSGDISISTKANDPIFAGSSIALTRAAVDPSTGAGTNKPATAINTITGWLDASMVYVSISAEM